MNRVGQVLGLVSLLFLGGGPACSSRGGETIVKTAQGPELRADDIDRDPLALLPSGPAGMVGMEMPQLFGSEFGKKSLELAQRILPTAPGAKFDPSRDLSRVVVGLYLMQGIDFVGVATGSFDHADLEASAANAAATRFGVPLVRSLYAGRTLYTANNMGFVVLTTRTALFGSETGIRRALDRIQEGRRTRDVPAWACDLVDRPSAPIVAAFDLQESPITQSVRDELPFVTGLARVRMLGNFQRPGVNLAGTAAYVDMAGAQAGAVHLGELQRLSQSWGWLASFLGIQQPLERLDTRLNGKELAFVAELDARAVVSVLDRALKASGALASSGSGK